MCGLVGIAGNLFKSDVDVFNEMLIADTFRGIHSTGVAAVSVNKAYAPSILKSTVPGWEFVTENSRYKDVVDNTAHILIGHNRHATVGGITKSNAHPFYVNDSIVGAHNGTLTNRLKIHDQSSFGTDSEAALNMMAVKSELETLQTIQGAWAFVWYNYTTNTLNFTRNSQRTLAIARSKNMTRLAWASEGDMLRWVLGRDKRNRNEWEDVHELEPNKIVSFEVPAKAVDPLREAPSRHVQGIRSRFQRGSLEGTRLLRGCGLLRRKLRGASVHGKPASGKASDDSQTPWVDDEVPSFLRGGSSEG
jgi:glutamine phosphoribosylpyrophosphate amidotransferase